MKIVMTSFSLSTQKCSAMFQAYSRGPLVLETRLIFHVVFVMLQVGVENFFYQFSITPSVSFLHCCIHSLNILSDDRPKASSKTIPPHSAI